MFKCCYTTRSVSRSCLTRGGASVTGGRLPGNAVREINSHTIKRYLCWPVLSCPGRMIANSIPARLVATLMRVALPRARACHCHAHAHGHTMRACARTYHAHAQGYAMHRDLASKIVQPVKIENQIQNRCPSGNADYLHFISSRKNTLCLII